MRHDNGGDPGRVETDRIAAFHESLLRYAAIDHHARRGRFQHGGISRTIAGNDVQTKTPRFKRIRRLLLTCGYVRFRVLFMAHVGMLRQGSRLICIYVLHRINANTDGLPPAAVHSETAKESARETAEDIDAVHCQHYTGQSHQQ